MATDDDGTYDGVTDVDDVQRVELAADGPLTWEAERYQRIGTLGRGGMGEIELCKDTRIARPVAMKVLRKNLRDDPNFRSRFLFEARLQGQLEHPSIVPVHDLGETSDGELFFTMKRIRGITLADALRSARAGKPTHSQRRLLTAFSSVCQAVDFAHARGVVHRDLKPQNIMLGDFGEVYVLDWGIAKLAGHTDTPVGEIVDVPGADTPTRAGAMLGTPMYMAPERAHGQADPRSDVYSLGVILGEILEAGDDIQIAPELAAISLRAARPSLAGRYATAREVHDAIERYLDGDRDLEARRKLAEEHVARAEAALAGAATDPAARTTTAREVGRALGLDPSNTRALRILMRLLGDMPAELPPEAQAEIDRRRIALRARTMKIGAFSTLALLCAVPFILWCGLRDVRLFAGFVTLTVIACAVQLQTSRSPRGAWFVAAMVTQLLAATSLTFSLGLLGVVPAAFTVATAAWRMTVARTRDGVVIVLAMFAALTVPLLLSATGAIAPMYAFDTEGVRLLPQMHHLPLVPTLAYVVCVTIGVIAAASIFGRLFVQEIRHGETQLTFQAWQLQQLLPPEPS